jgi:hypothetical protein
MATFATTVYGPSPAETPRVIYIRSPTTYLKLPTERWPHGDNERCFRCGEPGATAVDHDHSCPWHGSRYVCTMCFRGMVHPACNNELRDRDSNRRQWIAMISRDNRDSFRRSWIAMGGTFDVATETWEAS